jgi:hypothetical protein
MDGGQRKPPQPSAEAASSSAVAGQQIAIPRHLHGWPTRLFLLSAAYRALQQELDEQHRSAAVATRAKETVEYLQAKQHDDAMHLDKMHKYSAWARDTLPATAGELFRRHAGSDSTAPVFLDLGASPGGLSSFLSGDLRWRGTAISLAVSDGGMPMMFRGQAPPAHSNAAASGARPASSIASGGFSLKALLKPKPQAVNAPAPANGAAPAGAGRFRVLTGDIRSPDIHEHLFREVAPHSCDFVMAGAVQDHSQRSQAQPSSSDLSGGELFRAQLLQRLQFLTSQLRVVRKALRKSAGGSFMLVMGPVDCASVMVVLRHLRAVAQRVRIIGTLHIDKPPVYLLALGCAAWEDGGDAAEGDRGADVVRSSWRALLDPAALAASADVINHAAESLLGQQAPTEAPTDSAALQEAEALFMTAPHFDDLEDVFEARRKRLAGQRARAEQRLEVATDTPRWPKPVSTVIV